MTEQTAQDVAQMIDIHDRPGQSRRFQRALRQEIMTALGGSQNGALNAARSAARSLDKLGIRSRSPWIGRDPRLRPADLPGTVADRHRKPRASTA